jgi:ABC-2 type transport system permease protein
MTATDVRGPVRVPARRSPRGLGQLCRTEILLFLREPAAMFFTLVFPMALLLFVGLAYSGSDDTGTRYIDLYVPQIVATIAVNLGVLGVAINIAECRESGVLRRYRLAPVPMWWFWLSQVVVGLLMFVLSAALLLGVVSVTYGVRLDDPVPFAAVTLLGLAVAFVIGVLLGNLRMPVRSVQIIGTSVFFVMFLGSGAAVPRSSFPEWLRLVTAVNPMSPVVDASTSAYLGRPLRPHLVAIGVLVVFTVILLEMARRVSRWEADR